MRAHVLLAVVGSIALTGACGEEPVGFSNPVGLTMKLASGDVEAGRLTEEKNVNTESGNPYGAFIGEATDALGTAPGRLELTGLELTLESTSKNVTAVNEVFDGTVTVAFVMSESGTTVPVGDLAVDPSVLGAGPLPMNVTFDSAAISDADWPKFIGGGFKVTMSGPAQAEFESRGADADFELTLTFAAFEE